MISSTPVVSKQNLKTFCLDIFTVSLPCTLSCDIIANLREKKSKWHKWGMGVLRGRGEDDHEKDGSQKSRGTVPFKYTYVLPQISCLVYLANPVTVINSFYRLLFRKKLSQLKTLYVI